MSDDKKLVETRKELLINGFIHQFWNEDHEISIPNVIIEMFLIFCGVVIGAFDVGDELDYKFNDDDTKKHDIYDWYPIKIKKRKSLNTILIEYNTKYNETKQKSVVIGNNAICRCTTECECSEHQIAESNAQSKYNHLIPLTLQMLKHEKSARERKIMIGHRLFKKIQVYDLKLAGKITGMLLEMDDIELLNILNHESALIWGIQHTYTVLVEKQRLDKL
eukprot:553508_1